MITRTLFVGIGSPHGDDRLGWQVADALADRLQASHGDLPGGISAGSISPGSCRAGVAIRKAASPADILNWMEGIDRLLICDACRSGGLPGVAYRWNWPDRVIERAHCSGSHDLGLASVLGLAQGLQKLPQVVIVWGIEAENLQRQDDLSASVTARLPGIVDTIWSDLDHA